MQIKSVLFCVATILAVSTSAAPASGLGSDMSGGSSNGDGTKNGAVPNLAGARLDQPLPGTTGKLLTPKAVEQIVAQVLAAL
jgi:hypothetical protein